MRRKQNGGLCPQLLDFSKPWKEPAIRSVKDPHLLRQPWSKLPTKAWLISISTQLPKMMVPSNSSSSNCWDSQQEDKQLREKSKLCRSELFDPANSLLMALCCFKQCPTSMTLHQTWTIHQHFQTCPKQFTIYTYFNIISHISLVFISKSPIFGPNFDTSKGGQPPHLSPGEALLFKDRRRQAQRQRPRP